MMQAEPDTLLAIIELGGYPNFTQLYKRMGYEVIMLNSVRKALGTLKKTDPKIVVAEFNFQSDFRDRTSSLESMMSVVERLPETRVIVFYEKEYVHQFERLLAVHSFHRTFTFPVPEDELATCIEAIATAFAE